MDSLRPIDSGSMVPWMPKPAAVVTRQGAATRRLLSQRKERADATRQRRLQLKMQKGGSKSGSGSKGSVSGSGSKSGTGGSKLKSGKIKLQLGGLKLAGLSFGRGGVGAAPTPSRRGCGSG